MQTITKQKLTAILIAFTMILTAMMQLFIPITVHAEEIERNITIPCSVTLTSNDKVIYSVNEERTFYGLGKYVLKGYLYKYDRTKGQGVNLRVVLYSDKPFYYYDSYNNKIQSLYYKNVYYSELPGGITSSDYDVDVSYSYANILQTTEVPPTPQQVIDSGNLDLSKDDYEEKTFDEVATYDKNIPTPKFKVEKNLRFEFLNNESDYYYEIKGRWYTTDDFYLHLGGFMNAIWLYDYDTIYKNELTDWITYKDKRNSAITGYLKDIGEKSFNDLITKYPIGTRQITGEKNKDGSYKAGFDHASSNLVMWLKDATSIYNGIEVYIRYYKVDESGNYTYGKWAHYYNGLAKQSGAEVNDNVLNDVEHNYSDKGLTNDELSDLENSGQSKGDTDIITDYGDNGGGILTEIDKLDEIDFSNVVKVILSLFQQTKSIFNMFTTVISFMPNWVTELIGVSVVIICLIGIWKALR